MKFGLIITLFIILHSCSLCLAQEELQITYSVKNGEYPYTSKVKANLVANNSQILFFENVKSMFLNNDEECYGRDEKRNLIYKDLTSNTMWEVGDKRCSVRESMSLIEWRYLPSSDSILKYPCKKAVAQFRGREYVVWFTTELPFRAAPWKIHGLPGVVLRLESTDKFYFLKAIKLSIVKSSKKIKVPLEDNGEIISWREMISRYKKQIEEAEKHMKALEIQYGRKYYRAYPKLEVIIEENRETVDEMTGKIVERQRKWIE